MSKREAWEWLEKIVGPSTGLEAWQPLPTSHPYPPVMVMSAVDTA